MRAFSRCMEFPVQGFSSAGCQRVSVFTVCSGHALEYVVRGSCHYIMKEEGDNHPSVIVDNKVDG
jgi:hypothetical protein